MLTLLDFLVAPFLLVFGFVTAFEDTRTDLIRNKWIAAAILYAGLALASQIAYLRLAGQAINWGYLALFAGNALLSLALAVVIWLAQLWTAADAKLFLAYALLVPLQWYRLSLFPGFPALTLLVYALLPFMSFHALAIIKRAVVGPGQEKVRRALCAGLAGRRQLHLLLFLFGFSWLVGRLLALALPRAARADIVLQAGCILLIYWIARRYLGRWLLRIAAAAAVLRVVLDAQSLLQPGFLADFAALYLVVAILALLLIEGGQAAFSDRVPFSSLVPEMIPEEDVREIPSAEGSTYRVAGGSKEGKSLFAHRSEGMSASEAALLRELGSTGKLAGDALVIGQGIPFAPFMALGALIAFALFVL